MVLARRVLIVSVCLSLAFVGSMAWAFGPPSSVSVEDLIPLANWQKQFKITDGRDRGEIVPLVFHPGAGDRDRWRLDFGNYAGIRLKKHSSGALLMERLDLFKGKSFIVYEPALAILARDISSGVSVVQHANFKMYDLETGKLKRTGRATHQVKQISPAQFTTPAGLIDGYFVEIEHDMDMRFAQLQMSLGLGLRLDEGPVYGSGRYTLTKLGIFPQTKTAAAALAIR